MCDYRSETAVSRIIDFDWHAAPLFTQSRLLLEGDVYPVWTRFSPPLIVLLAVSGLLFTVIARRRASLRWPFPTRADPPRPAEQRIA
jgi:hypothetical protein